MQVKKSVGHLITAASTAVVVLLVTTFTGDGLEKLEQGEDAATADQIKSVLEETMVVQIDGETKTYGEVLSSLHTRMTRLEVNQENMKEALGALSEE